MGDRPVLAASTFTATIQRAILRPMNDIKEFWKQYSPYFLDIWQYLVILLVVIIAAIVIL